MKGKSIDTYAINLLKRVERRAHIGDQFRKREEFKVQIVPAIEDEIGTRGLWNTIRRILEEAESKAYEHILICEDDHVFTSAYSKNLLFSAIEQCKELDAQILLGGVSWFDFGLQVAENLFWINNFSGLQFMIIYKRFYRTLLDYEFSKNDISDLKIASLATLKYVVTPSISTQKEFGYSDVTLINNQPGRVDKLFNTTSERFAALKYLKSLFTNYKR